MVSSCCWLSSSYQFQVRKYTSLKTQQFLWSRLCLFLCLPDSLNVLQHSLNCNNSNPVITTIIHIHMTLRLTAFRPYMGHISVKKEVWQMAIHKCVNSDNYYIYQKKGLVSKIEIIITHKQCIFLIA